AGKTFRWSKSDQIVVGGRYSDGSAGVASHADGREVRRNGSASSAARSARISQGVVEIARLAAERTDRQNAGSQLVHVRFCDDNIQLRSLTVVGLNSRKICLDKSFRCDTS